MPLSCYTIHTKRLLSPDPTTHNSRSLQDATLAQHHLSADLASARSEAAALRAAHEAAGEYAQSMARTLRRHGLAVPEPPTAAEVASQIGALQVRIRGTGLGGVGCIGPWVRI